MEKWMWEMSTEKHIPKKLFGHNKIHVEEEKRILGDYHIEYEHEFWTGKSL